MLVERGFTLIELVMVITVVGAIASVAMPKFIDLENEAERASAKTSMGAFKSGVDILHAKWVVDGKPSIVTNQGIPFTVNAEGWATGSTANNAGCMEMWNTLLLTPPAITDYSAGSPVPAWSTLRAGSICIYYNQYGKAVSASTSYFIYFTVTFSPAFTAGSVFGLNMP